MKKPTRSIEMEHVLDATPEEVWEMLTTSEGLRRWFPLDARVGEGESQEVWISWGPGCEGGSPIHAWEPGKHFGWSDTSLAGFPEEYGAGDADPVPVAIDFHIESRDGKTVLRLVQSGLSTDAEWDEMVDAMVDGWTFYLFNLAWYFLRHRGKPRQMVWRRVATDLTRDAVWERLVGAALVSAVSGGELPPQPSVNLGEPHAVEVVSEREGHHFAAKVPGLDDSLLFIQSEGRHVGVWLSTYSLPPQRVAALQTALDESVSGALGD